METPDLKRHSAMATSSPSAEVMQLSQHDFMLRHMKPSNSEVLSLKHKHYEHLDDIPRRKATKLNKVDKEFRHQSRIASSFVDTIRGKSLCELEPTELFYFHTEVLKALNELLQKYRIKPVRTEFLKSMYRNLYGISSKQWWTPWKLPLTATTQDKKAVTKQSIVKSLSVASIPVDTDDNMNNLRQIPILVFECGEKIRRDGLHTEGIFRVSGSEKRISALTEAFNVPPNYGLNCSFEGFLIHDVCDCLKRYLRALPEPLLTTDLYPFFLQTFDIEVFEDRLQYVIYLILLLPRGHLVTFEYLISLFDTILENAKETQMDTQNMARVFSPNFLWSKNRVQTLEETITCNRVLQFLLENRKEFNFSSKRPNSEKHMAPQIIQPGSPNSVISQASAPT